MPSWADFINIGAAVRDPGGSDEEKVLRALTLVRDKRWNRRELHYGLVLAVAMMASMADTINDTHLGNFLAELALDQDLRDD